MEPPLSSYAISTIVELLYLNYNKLVEFVTTDYIQDLIYPAAFYKLHRSGENKPYTLGLTSQAVSLLTAIRSFASFRYVDLPLKTLADDFRAYVKDIKAKACYTDIVASRNGYSKWVYLDNEEALIAERYSSFMEHKIDSLFGYCYRNLNESATINTNINLVAFKYNEQYTPILLSVSEDGIIQDLYYYDIEDDRYYEDFCLLLTTLNLSPQDRWAKPFNKFLKLNIGWFYD